MTKVTNGKQTFPFPITKEEYGFLRDCIEELIIRRRESGLGNYHLYAIERKLKDLSTFGNSG